jgi:hypothetical protein
VEVSDRRSEQVVAEGLMALACTGRHARIHNGMTAAEDSAAFSEAPRNRQQDMVTRVEQGDHEFKAFQEFVKDRAVRYRYLGFSRQQVAVRVETIGDRSA